MFVFKTNHLRQVKTLSNHIAYYSNACESLRNVIKERDEKLYALEDSLKKAQESAVFWEQQYAMQLASTQSVEKMLIELQKESGGQCATISH